MRKSKLTLERHKEIGQELYKMQLELGKIMLEVSNSYPLKNNALHLAGKTHSYLGRLRSVLESQMFIDYPNLGDDALRIYYPGIKPKAQLSDNL